MQTKEINIRNFKGIEDLQKEINGKSVYLVGKNGSGKTSFIDAVWCGLTGKNLPETPIHNNKKKGLIEIDLGDCIARTKFVKDKPARFELERKEFDKEADKFIKSPRGYLEKKIGLLNFDIEEFFAKSNAEQVKYFAKIVGVDFSDLDGDIEELTDTRKFDKKKLAEYENKNAWYKKEDLEREFINVVELSQKINKAKELAANQKRVLEALETKQKEASELAEKLVEKKAEVAKCISWLDSAKDKITTADAIEKMDAELQNSDDLNNSKREATEAKEAEKEVDNYKAMIEQATSDIDKKRQEKAKRISKNIKVDGLTYDVNGERFLYDGLPFDNKQINTASQLIAGMKIASTMLKELRILRVDGSLIDKSNMHEVEAWANENDIQLFVEVVDRDGGEFSVNINEG